MNTSKFWTVFGIGVAAGAAVALIYAPEAGVDTRRRIKQGFDDGSIYVKDATSQLGDQAQEVIARGKTAVSSAVDSAIAAAASATDSAKKAASLVGDTAKQAAAAATDAAKKKVSEYA